MMKKKAAPKKRGQLGLTEEQFIRDNYGILSVEEIEAVATYVSESTN